MPHPSPVSEADLFSALEQGATLVTVNRRLSRGLLNRYHLRMQSKGHSAWETPDILPWGGWMSRCLDRASYLHPEVSHPVSLTQDQELALWEDVIRSSEQARGLMHVSEAARQVRQAWILLWHWNLEDNDDPLLWSSPEHEAFRFWSREFQARVESRGWLEEARQPHYLVQLLGAGRLPCPEGFCLAGFEQLSPIQERLLFALAAQGCPVMTLELQPRASRVRAVALSDRQQEMSAAARWVRTHLESSPDQRIGVIVPDLTQVRAELEHTFDAVLHPDAAPSPVSPQERIYDLSLGRPLSVYPMIQAAMGIVDLIQDPLPLAAASAVLTSPFIHGADSELCARGRLEAALRKRREPAITWKLLLGLAQPEDDHPGPRSCPLLARALRSFQSRWRELPGSQPPSAWAQDLELLLRDMGWPGERSVSSPEYQTLQAWKACLQRLAGLDRVRPHMTLAQARDRLQAILGQTVFQPEGPDVQVRIMGMLEAVGERFDRIWVMSLTDQVWPPGPDPNPFLPVTVQRRLNMPRSSPEHELEYARRITARLQESSPEVILSHPQREEDRDLLPSPLIQGVPYLGFDDLGLAPWPDPWLQRGLRQDLESFVDEQGPGLPAPGRTPGGSSLLRAQAACPFQAFARHRLGARSLEEPVAGLGPPERGTIMHSALEHFWQRCRDQATLLGLSGQERTSWVRRAVQQAIEGLRTQRPLTLTHEFTALEEERLVRLLLEWLELETRRRPFQVQDLERRFDISINGLQLNVVADRIDRLDNGRLVVIDYKAGRHSLSEWFQERPVEPQVPLYSLFCPEPVAGVFFGVVRRGESCFVGLGEEPDIVPGCQGFAEHKLTRGFASWENLLSTWRNSLEALAGEVLRGWARVAPSTPQACRQCDVQPLCRVFESQRSLWLR